MQKGYNQVSSCTLPQIIKKIPLIPDLGSIRITRYSDFNSYYCFFAAFEYYLNRFLCSKFCILITVFESQYSVTAVIF